ncbi:MAG: 16S rRNA (uracil(1498)-N(3))-methyltransferase [Alphaproteobacteria bacterium]
MAEPRLYVEDELMADSLVKLDRARAHYLVAVLRRKVDDPVVLFNGRDGAWRAVLAVAYKSEATLHVEAQLAPQAASPDLWLLFAPLKHAPIDFLVEKATELGVRRLLPVLTRYTQSERLNLDRLRARAIEAAEQSERLDVPEVAAAQELGRALDGWPAERPLLVCDEAGGEPIMAALERLRTEGKAGAPLALLTGPEGGLADDDRKALSLVPSRLAVSLGPRILRAETAALAALACTQSVLGDWATPRR